MLPAKCCPQSVNMTRVTGALLFCENKKCRLFNAHWQKDLFYSQLENKKLCDKHQEKLNEIRNQV